MPNKNILQLHVLRKIGQFFLWSVAFQKFSFSLMVMLKKFEKVSQVSHERGNILCLVKQKNLNNILISSEFFVIGQLVIRAVSIEQRWEEWREKEGRRGRRKVEGEKWKEKRGVYNHLPLIHK